MINFFASVGLTLNASDLGLVASSDEVDAGCFKTSQIFFNETIFLLHKTRLYCFIQNAGSQSRIRAKNDMKKNQMSNCVTIFTFGISKTSQTFFR